MTRKDSPAPGTPQTPTKALVALVGAAATAALAVFLDNDRVQLVAGLLALVSTGVATYYVPNTASVRKGRRRNEAGATAGTLALCALAAIGVLALLVWLLPVNARG